MKKLFDDSFIEIIRKKILANEFDSKEKIVDYLRKMNESVLNDSALMQRLKEEGIIVNSDELSIVIKDLLEYYDNSKTDTTSLNLDGVSQFKVENSNKDYIKINNQDGSYTVLDDSMNDKSFVDQMKERQNESISLQTSDGIKNKEEIVKDMAQDKEEAAFTASTDINVRDLTPEERRQFQAVMHLTGASEINFVVDTKRNLYINRDTGETYYVTKNQYGQMEVKKADEQTSETITTDVDYISPEGVQSSISIDNPSDIDLESLEDSDLQYIRDNRLDSLTPEQKAALFEILERRKERMNNGGVKLESPKVHTKKILTQPYNGFSSLILFTLLVFGFSVACVIYMILSII